MRRLSVVDEIFLRTHRGMGTPIALQGLWRTGDPVAPAELHRLHEALRGGPLGRRVERSRVPGARAQWRRNESAHPIGFAPAPLAPAEVVRWAETLGEDLDPAREPGWRLAAAPVTDGGTVVALTCSHVLADARGLIIAAEQALAVLTGGRGEPDRAPVAGPDPTSVADRAGGAEQGREQSAEPTGGPVAGLLQSDWADAAWVWGRVLRGTSRAAVQGVRGASHAAGRGNGAPDLSDTNLSNLPAAGTSNLPVSGLILRCSAAEWERIAAESGGTANSLFIWLVAQTLWAAGFPRDRIAASLPVDTRDEPRVDNDLAVTEIVLRPTDGPAAIRAKSRAAYEYRMSSPAGLPEEFLHLVPDRVAYRLSRGAGERDILCSNIGVIPPALHMFGTHECTGVATRAIHPGLTYGGRPRTRLSGYLCRYRDDYILTLAGLYPERVADSGALHRFVTGIAARAGLPLAPW
ncbi:hypothetical protein [Nocardia sp. NPDC024068]|uniref:hypothetical protein n=1 Tax=Nocardia sp. NPDC024068 TaxID=3157197 RepID=UPI0033FED1D9